jgi:hypothetical protein
MAEEKGLGLPRDRNHGDLRNPRRDHIIVLDDIINFKPHRLITAEDKVGPLERSCRVCSQKESYNRGQS